MSYQSSNRFNAPSSMKDALNKPSKTSDSSIIIKGKIDKTKVDNPAAVSLKVENPAALANSSSKVKKGAPHRQAIAVAASIDIDNNKEVTAAGDDYEASKISKNKKSTKQEELESVLNLSKWSSQIGADDDDEGLDDW